MLNYAKNKDFSNGKCHKMDQPNMKYVVFKQCQRIIYLLIMPTFLFNQTASVTVRLFVHLWKCAPFGAMGHERTLFCRFMTVRDVN